jgi:hypothetical protein
VPDQVPGGPSNGYAVAVGVKLVDFALDEFLPRTGFVFLGLSLVD